MLRNTVLGFIATITLTFSSLASANPQVYGSWAAQHQEHGLTLTMLISISANQTLMGAKCEFQGQSADVSVTVPSEVTATQIVITGSAHDAKQVAGIDCAVDVVPMAFDYQLSGDTLTLSSEGQTLPFTRVK